MREKTFIRKVSVIVNHEDGTQEKSKKWVVERPGYGFQQPQVSFYDSFAQITPSYTFGGCGGSYGRSDTPSWAGNELQRFGLI
jgi:hypothetical protein